MIRYSTTMLLDILPVAFWNEVTSSGYDVEEQQKCDETAVFFRSRQRVAKTKSFKSFKFSRESRIFFLLMIEDGMTLLHKPNSIRGDAWTGHPSSRSLFSVCVERGPWSSRSLLKFFVHPNVINKQCNTSQSTTERANVQVNVD